MALLRSWRPGHPDQAALREDFLAHLQAHPDGVDRACRPDHVTASALVVSDDGQAVLLHHHRKVGRWLQFGGHIDATDGSLAAAALREATEESGLAELRLVSPWPMRLDRHGAPCDPKARHHLDVQFVAVAQRSAVPTRSAESLAVAWFDADALPRDCDASVRELVAAGAQRVVRAEPSDQPSR